MLTKLQFADFRKEAEKALEDIAEKYNATVHCGKINYDANSFRLQVEVSKKEVNGVSFEKAEFERYCSMYGFKKEDYQKTFTTGNDQYTLVGFNTKARTMPILALKSDGRRYKFGTYVLKLLDVK